MANNYYEDRHLTLQRFQKCKLVIRVCTNQPTNATSFNPDISVDNNDIDYDRSLSYLCQTSNVNTQECSSLSNLTPLCDDSKKSSFNPKEWFITNSSSGKLRAPRQNEFLLLLLENPHYSAYISWLDKNQGLFRIHLPEDVATLWANVKNRKTNGLMDYQTFTRGIRSYYKSGSMIKTNKKQTFRFKVPIDIIS